MFCIYVLCDPIYLVHSYFMDVASTCNVQIIYDSVSWMRLPCTDPFRFPDQILPCLGLELLALIYFLVLKFAKLIHTEFYNPFFFSFTFDMGY